MVIDGQGLTLWIAQERTLMIWGGCLGRSYWAGWSSVSDGEPLGRHAGTIGSWLETRTNSIGGWLALQLHVCFGAALGMTRAFSPGRAAARSHARTR